MTGAVLITGARAPVSIDLVRAFRAAGHDVHLADCVAPWAARGLRPCIPIHRLPPPRGSFTEFRAAMAELVKSLGVVQVVPTCEEVFWLAEAAARDGYADLLFAPTLALLRRLHSKALFPGFATELGLDVPETHVVDAAINFEDMIAPLDDVVLKPEFSRFATQTVLSPDAAALRALRPTAQRRWVMQRRIRGEEVCSWSAIRSGRVVAYAAYRPRWRHGKSAAFQMEAMDSPAVRSITERIAAATAMTGHLSFDVIVDGDGRAFPIECNPRAVSGLHLFDADPQLADAMLQGTFAMPPVRPGTLRHMAPAMALIGIPTAFGQGRLGHLVADWRAGQDVIDRERQGLVTLGCLADAGRFGLQALRMGRPPSAATTADIEWDGEAMP